MKNVDKINHTTLCVVMKKSGMVQRYFPHYMNPSLQSNIVLNQNVFYTIISLNNRKTHLSIK